MVFTYSNGEIYKVALTGLKDVNPHQDNTILIFRQTSFYKNLAK